jgi:hypothetical protein
MSTLQPPNIVMKERIKSLKLVIEMLLETCELNLDTLEPETIASIKHANKVLNNESNA